MKTLLSLTVVCILIVSSCKKKDKIDEHSEKLAFYSNKNCAYLFTVPKEQFDSMLPIFFGEDMNGKIKFIVRAYKIGENQNISQLFDGKLQSWVLPNLDIEMTVPTDYFKLRDHIHFEYESQNHSPKIYYSESDHKLSKFTGQPWQISTSIGDNLSFRHTYFSAFENYDLEHIVYKFANTNFEDSFAYRARLFEHNASSYFVHFEPSTMYHRDSIWYSDLRIEKRNKSGILSQTSIITPLLVGTSGGTSGSVYGKYLRLIEAEQREPFIVFTKKWLGSDRIVVYEPFVKNTMNEISFDLPSQKSTIPMNYFYYKGFLYANSIGSKPYLFKITDGISTQINLPDLNIKGLYGSNKSILLVIKNENNELDVVALKNL